MMTNSDLGRLLKAFEIQSVLRTPMYVEDFYLNKINFAIFLIVNVNHVVK
jgi:hypothetical protein